MSVSVPPWRLVVPVKRLDLAKTRLSPLDGPDRARLALAFAQDVVSAATMSPSIAAIAVVTADADVTTAMPSSVSIIDDDECGDLNGAINIAIRRLGAGPIAVIPADLPALTGAVLTAALDAAAIYPHSFISDMDNVGTVLAASTGAPLSPMFGDASAARHLREGVAELIGGWPQLRRDVDTIDHLRQAIDIGVGRHTVDALGALTSTL